MVKIEKSWQNLLRDEFQKPYFLSLIKTVRAEYAKHKVYPPGKEIFRAFDLCPTDDVSVVILGQDPYHQPGQANGLAFSVRHDVQNPPSLQNILQEVRDDIGSTQIEDGDLTPWAKQGVLLLNATLTVRDSEAGSHSDIGWQKFTDAVITKLSRHKRHIVYMLWGNYAKSKEKLIDPDNNLILKSAHPSPLAANRGGWFGNHHFSRANRYLLVAGKKPIVW